MSEQLQSYFYVLWPKDRSSVAATSPTSPIYINTDGPKVGAAGEGSSSLAAIDTVLQPSSTSPPVYTVLGKHPAVVTGASSLPLVVGATEHSLTATSRAAGGCSSVVAVVSGTEESGSDSSDAVSSLTVSTQSIATTAAEAAQTVTITDSGEYSGSLTIAPASIITSTTPHKVLVSPKSHAFTGLAGNGAGSLTTACNPVSSPGLIYVSDAATMLPRSGHQPCPGHQCGSSSIFGTSASALLHPVQTSIPFVRNYLA